VAPFRWSVHHHQEDLFRPGQGRSGGCRKLESGKTVRLGEDKRSGPGIPWKPPLRGKVTPEREK